MQQAATQRLYSNINSATIATINNANVDDRNGSGGNSNGNGAGGGRYSPPNNNYRSSRIVTGGGGVAGIGGGGSLFAPFDDPFRAAQAAALAAEIDVKNVHMLRNSTTADMFSNYHAMTGGGVDFDFSSGSLLPSNTATSMLMDESMASLMAMQQHYHQQQQHQHHQQHQQNQQQQLHQFGQYPIGMAGAPAFSLQPVGAINNISSSSSSSAASQAAAALAAVSGAAHCFPPPFSISLPGCGGGNGLSNSSAASVSSLAAAASSSCSLSSSTTAAASSTTAAMAAAAAASSAAAAAAAATVVMPMGLAPSGLAPNSQLSARYPMMGGHMTDLDTDPRELERFAEHFKQRRIKLGVTQADVGKALAHLKMPGVGSLSQSTICRFESLTLSHNNMVALKPILHSWLEKAEDVMKRKDGLLAGDGGIGLIGMGANGVNGAGSGADVIDRLNFEAHGILPNSEKKRKRTSIAAPEKRSLEHFFRQQPRPTGDRISAIAEQLDLKKNVVRVWFCNQRQKQKRSQFRSRNQGGGNRSGASTSSSDNGNHQHQQQQNNTNNNSNNNIAAAAAAAMAAAAIASSGAHSSANFCGGINVGLSGINSNSTIANNNNNSNGVETGNNANAGGKAMGTKNDAHSAVKNKQQPMTGMTGVSTTKMSPSRNGDGANGTIAASLMDAASVMETVCNGQSGSLDLTSGAKFRNGNEMTSAPGGLPNFAELSVEAIVGTGGAMTIDGKPELGLGGGGGTGGMNTVNFGNGLSLFYHHFNNSNGPVSG